MPRGRKPRGGRALTGAERQALYRVRRSSNAIAPISPATAQPGNRKPGARSRPQRWHAAVAELVKLQSEYVAWLDTMPEALQNSATAEALQAIVDLDLDEVCTIQPPRGFGRD